MEVKRIKNSQNNFENKKLDDFHYQISKCNIKLYSKQKSVTVRRIVKQYRIENLEINSCINGRLTFDKDTKAIQWGTYLFNKRCLYN